MKRDQDRGIVVEVAESGVATMTIRGRGRLNMLDQQAHVDLNEWWPRLDADPRVRSVLVMGEGDAFCAGGDLDEWKTKMEDPCHGPQTLATMIGLVRNMVACGKPVVAAVRGPAVGVGLALALLSDITVVGDTAKLGDGHVPIGLPAGDHAALVWPLLCGMAKAKRYLLLGDLVDGREAERIGLVSDCVADDRVIEVAAAYADRLAAGPLMAVSATKAALNHWLTAAMPAFEFSAAAEVIAMSSLEGVEGLAAFVEGRPADFRHLPG